VSQATPTSPAAPLSYQQAGVDYARIDPLKILAQQAAASTAGQLAQHGLQEVAASRGESAYVVDCGEFYLASITDCLGTKALVADAMRAITGRTYYDAIAQDTLAEHRKFQGSPFNRTARVDQPLLARGLPACLGRRVVSVAYCEAAGLRRCLRSVRERAERQARVLGRTPFPGCGSDAD
jgi:hypothetical protein